MKISIEDFETLAQCLSVFDMFNDVFYEMYPNGVKELEIFQNVEMTEEDARLAIESLIKKQVKVSLELLEKYSAE